MNKRRGISIARERRDEIAARVTVPVLGTVSAGQLTYAEENVIGDVSVYAYLVRNGRYFGLQVDGNSMIGAGICNGDTVVVRQ